jgi:MurNAc alpha-1-phosphate uridylyltransferase
MIAMLLAAGRGERLRPLTDTLPKALIEVAGVSLLERHLQMLAASGVTTVVINLGWCGEQIVERIGAGKAFGLHVVYSPENGNVLETGGGIQRALPLLGTAPFWVVNADVFTDYRIDAAVLPEDSLAHLVLVNTPAYRAVGDFDLVGDRVRNSASPSLTFSGMACYRPAFFQGLEPGRFPLAPLLRRAANEGSLSGVLFTGAWEDVGTPERLAALNRAHERHAPGRS